MAIIIVFSAHDCITYIIQCTVEPAQVDKKMCAELANVNHCAVPFLSRAAVNLCGTTTMYRLAVQQDLIKDFKKVT